MAIPHDIEGQVALNRHAVGYVRVSTKELNEETQIQQLLVQGVPQENIFTDTAVSGTTPAGQRQGFRRLLDHLRKQLVAGDPVRVLYVFEISRIGRSFLETLEAVQSLEEQQNVIVWSLSPKEAWTQTKDRSIRNLMIAIFSWAAEQERESLRERTKAGVARAREEGKHIGRPFKEISWRKVEEYREKGLSWAAISRVMDIPYNTLMRAKARHSS